MVSWTRRPCWPSTSRSTFLCKGSGTLADRLRSWLPIPSGHDNLSSSQPNPGKERPEIRRGRGLRFVFAFVKASYPRSAETDDAVVTRLDEPPTVKKITDELCGMAVVVVTARVAAKNRIARFGPLAHDPAAPLRLHPILVIRDDGQQTAMLTGGTGFDLVYDVKWHGARLCPMSIRGCRSWARPCWEAPKPRLD